MKNKRKIRCKCCNHILKNDELEIFINKKHICNLCYDGTKWKLHHNVKIKFYK